MDKTIEALEDLAETFDTWSGNIHYNNHDNRADWDARAIAFGLAALETRRKIKELTQ